MNIVIIEDEAPARRKLLRFLQDIEEPVTVIAELSSVIDAISFLQDSQNIDLIISDIELLDGNAFSIYQQVQVPAPIIFTTAYNQFVMDAFEGNGIEYLLKPFSFERFKKAWNKFLLLRNHSNNNQELINKIGKLFEQKDLAKKEFKRRFSINTSRGTYFLEVNKIVYFIADQGVIIAIDIDQKKHFLSYPTLKELENLVDPNQFFRINRSELVNKQFIEQIERYNKNTIALKLKGLENQLITSQSSTAAFKEWIEC